MKIQALKRRLALAGATLMLALGGVLQVATVRVGASPTVVSQSEINAAIAGCEPGSFAAGRAWNGSTYAPFGAGMWLLKPVSPSSQPLTITKPFDISGNGNYVQVAQIATYGFSTLTSGKVVTYTSGSYDLTPQGYQEIIEALAGPSRNIKLVSVCVSFGGFGEDEGIFYIPVSPSDLYW